jgi:hypothetical protein
LAQSSARADHADDAIVSLEQAVSEMETLCVEFPWNKQYWDLVGYFPREAVRVLQGVQRQNAAAELVEQSADWLKKSDLSCPIIQFPKHNCSIVGQN